MKILLFGRDGQLGSDLYAALSGVSELSAYGIDDLDLTQLEQLEKVLDSEHPQLIINAAAYTAVDRAESEAGLAARVNCDAPAVMARKAAATGAGMIHFSTDYVFDGGKGGPYTEEDKPSPESVYGRTKLDGEIAVRRNCANSLVLRTSWVYSLHGQNFLRTMLRLANERDELTIVGDQFGAPTTTRALTDATLELVRYYLSHGEFPDGVRGTYHMTCGGETSWCGFARAIMDAANHADTRVTEITTADYPTPAKRPAYSGLSNDKLEKTFGIRLPGWEQALADCMKDYSA